MLSEVLGEDRATAIMQSVPPVPPLRSPLELYIKSQDSGGTSAMTADEFDQIAGNLTTTGGLYPSPINVNTAPEAVLACIPGLRDLAQTIVATRQQRTQPSTGLAWIVDAIGDREVATAAGPYITGQSWQVMADVAAVGRYGRGYRRTKFIIDNSTGTPRIIYRRNLSPLGWTLGNEVRQDLALRKDRR